MFVSCKNKLAPQGQSRSQKGFTMMEVMVSIVVMTFGLLGFAGLLAHSMKSNQIAALRSQATVLAHDIVECMRVNRVVAVNGSYNLALGSVPAGGSLAGDDLAGWRSRVAQSLPVGDASVSVDLNGSVTVVLQWDENGDGTPTRFTTQSAI